MGIKLDTQLYFNLEGAASYLAPCVPTREPHAGTSSCHLTQGNSHVVPMTN